MAEPRDGIDRHPSEARTEYVKYVAGWLRTRVERDAPAARPGPVRVAAEREAR